MATRQFRLSDEQAALLHSAFLQEKHGPTRTRYQAVRLYGIGYRLDEVIAITGCSRTSLFDWCRSYREEGLAGLVDKRAGGNSRKLTPAQIEELATKLHRYCPKDLFGQEAGLYWSVEALRRAIERWYGVTFKQNASYHGLFKRCGFSYQRPAKVYKSRREEDVLDFEQRLEKKAP
jgi:transposase